MKIVIEVGGQDALRRTLEQAAHGRVRAMGGRPLREPEQSPERADARPWPYPTGRRASR